MQQEFGPNPSSLESQPTQLDHSFIIKFWVEETAEEAGRLVWRGSMTHIPGGERRTFQDLEAISEFIMPFLQRMGFKPGLAWRLQHCSMRIKRVTR